MPIITDAITINHETKKKKVGYGLLTASSFKCLNIRNQYFSQFRSVSSLKSSNQGKHIILKKKEEFEF